MDKVETLYLKNGYFSKYGNDIWITILLIIITIIIVMYNAYKSVIQQIKSNWNEHKCSPIYLPFAGLIMPETGKSFVDTTIENFEYCIQSDISSVFNIIMMPFEFAAYVLVDCIDAITAILVAIAAFIEWLQELLGELFDEIFNKLIYVITPIIKMLLHYRDITSKSNGIFVTLIYSILNIYNTTISGATFLMTIVINVVGILIGIFYALIAIALALCASFFGIGAGLAILGVAIPIATAVIIPIIIIYIDIVNSFQPVLTQSAPNAPSRPRTSFHI
jgi:hypothetical protein